MLSVTQVCVCTDVLPTLLSSRILVGIETGGGARLGHALKTQQEQIYHHDDNNHQLNSKKQRVTP